MFLPRSYTAVQSGLLSLSRQRTQHWNVHRPIPLQPTIATLFNLHQKREYRTTNRHELLKHLITKSKKVIFRGVNEAHAHDEPRSREHRGKTDKEMEGIVEERLTPEEAREHGGKSRSDGISFASTLSAARGYAMQQGGKGLVQVLQLGRDEDVPPTGDPGLNEVVYKHRVSTDEPRDMSVATLAEADAALEAYRQTDEFKANNAVAEALKRRSGRW